MVNRSIRITKEAVKAYSNYCPTCLLTAKFDSLAILNPVTLEHQNIIEIERYTCQSRLCVKISQVRICEGKFV